MMQEEKLAWLEYWIGRWSFRAETAPPHRRGAALTSKRKALCLYNRLKETP